MKKTLSENRRGQTETKHINPQSSIVYSKADKVTKHNPNSI